MARMASGRKVTRSSALAQMSVKAAAAARPAVQGATEGCGVARVEPLGQQGADHSGEHVAGAGLGERGSAPVHDLGGAVGRGDEGHRALEGHNGSVGLGERAGQGGRRRGGFG